MRPPGATTAPVSRLVRQSAPSAMSTPAILGRPDPTGANEPAPDGVEPAAHAEADRLREEIAGLRALVVRLHEDVARAAERQERVVGRLAGGMAHDFNNLLTIIVGYATLIDEDAETSPGARHRLAEVLRASSCAKDLTQKLLVLSRKQPSEPRTLDLDPFLRRQAIEPIESLIGDGIRLTTRFAARDACVRIDPGELVQVLTTLVMNARDAMPGGGSLTIASSLEDFGSAGTPSAPKASGTFARIAVSDTGAGMDEDVQARLFEPYFTTKRLGAGAGLGLAMLKGVIERAGGFVDVQSAPNLGTTMTLWLPVTGSGSVEERARARTTVARGGEETVLVVDDDATVRELTRAILTRFGYVVTDVAHPHAAIALVREGHRFDLVVSDVVMPGMDGRQMIRELDAIAPGFAFLYVSGLADASGAGGDLAAEPAHFLPKPFTPSALAAKVRELLDAR